jgi:hypothetical protein
VVGKGKRGPIRTRPRYLIIGVVLATLLMVGVFVVRGRGQDDQADPAGSSSGRPVLKVSVLESGKVLADGQAVTLDQLDLRLGETKLHRGVVWYYREHPEKDAVGPLAHTVQQVLDLVMKHKLAISMSTKPDFSDYVDEDGRSHPRD